jgi:hypothetical protein
MPPSVEVYPERRRGRSDKDDLFELCQEGLEAPTARRWTAKSSALPDQPQSQRTTFVRAL